MIAKLLLQNSIFVVALGALLFASAGTLHWPAAWVFLVVSAILGPACGLWLAKTDPALLAERLRPTFQADQPAADKKFMLAFVVVTLIWLVAIGLGPARAGIRRSARAAGARACDVSALDRLHHVGVPRKFLCSARREGAGRAPPSRRSRAAPTPSSAIPCTAASCCSSSASRCCWDPGGAWRSRRCSPSVRHSRPHRGARAGRRTARLC